MPPKSLLELAREKFGELSEAEEKLFETTERGEDAKISEPDEGADLSKADLPVIRADRLVWLMTDKRAKRRVTHKGVTVKGARFEGELDLSCVDWSWRLGLLYCHVIDKINLTGASFGVINFGGTHTGPIGADGIRVKGDVFFRKGFKSQGEVRFIDAYVGGSFYCSNSVFCNEKRMALIADGIQVNGNVVMGDKFTAYGAVRFLGAYIGGDFDCSDGTFCNENGDALIGERAKISGSVFLRNGFTSRGEVRFLVASIGCDFSCAGGIFRNESGNALCAEKLTVKGNVYLRKSTIDGRVSFYSGTFGGVLAMDETTWENDAVLDLRQATIGTLYDDNNWPKKGNFHLDGFRYEAIHDGSPLNARDRLEWLDRQPDDQFHPQPYEQLAKVLKQAGHEQAAKEVQIGKNEKFRRMLWNKKPARLRRWYVKEFLKTDAPEKLIDLAGKMKKSNADLAEEAKNYPTLSWPSWAWLEISRKLTCYGYQTWRVLAIMLAMVGIGTLCFGFGHFGKQMTTAVSYSHTREVNLSGLDDTIDLPGTVKYEDAHRYDPTRALTLADDYPHFNAFIYSLDAFLPLVDLNQQTYWMPNMNEEWGPALRYYLVFHILMGWFLTSLLLVSFTGLIKQ